MEMRGPVKTDPGTPEEQYDRVAKSQEGAQDAGRGWNIGGGGAGGHYALNTEQIDARAKEVEEVVQEANGCYQDLQTAHEDIKAPAGDKHSGYQAGKGHDSMKAAMEHLQGIIDYGTRFAKDLRASAEKYRAQEEHAAGEFGRLADR
jgi:uncharacterized protein YukE